MGKTILSLQIIFWMDENDESLKSVREEISAINSRSQQCKENEVHIFHC